MQMQMKMQTLLTFRLSALLLFLISPPFFSAATAPPRDHHHYPQDLVRSSCVHARYPHLCIRTLSAYAGPANTPKDLAQAALKISLDHAWRLSHYLKTHASPALSVNDVKRRKQKAALSDCVEQISDSVEDLSKSLKELQHLRVETFQWQMSNAQTWVSAAMTEDDTCLDGLSFNGGVDAKLKRKINRVARVTSNALYMINRLCESRGKGKRSAKYFEPFD